MANELKPSQLVLNEVQVVQEMIKSKEIPSVWNVWQVVNRLTRYYLERDYDRYEVVGLVIEWLVEAKVDYDIDVVVEQVNKINVNDKDYYGLRELPTTIIFYDSEISTIKTIKNRTTQEFYFTLLLICKIQELKGAKSPNYIYSDLNDIGRLIKLNVGNVSKFLIELGYEMKLLSCPLDGNYIEVHTSNEGKKHRIKDFNPMQIQQYFINFFGEPEIKRPVMALDYWGDEEPLYFESLSDCSRALDAKVSDIGRCLDRMWAKNGAISAKDYMYIDATRLENETDEHYNVRMYAKRMRLYAIQKYYRKIKSGKIKLNFDVTTETEDGIAEYNEFMRWTKNN